MMVRKQSKRQLLCTNSPLIATDSLQPTFPPNYYASHETDYTTEKENLEEISEGKRDSNHEDSLDASFPQEHSDDEAGM